VPSVDDTPGGLKNRVTFVAPESDRSRRFISPVRPFVFMSASSPTVAVGALPYALPFALGLVCLVWRAVELVAPFVRHWVAVDLVPSLVVSVLGAGGLLFGGVGALAHTLRAVRGE
jgi:hypothetical protein